MVGTPEFMSPEQVLSSRDIDYRADLWALGVVTYYALTGKVPFSGETLGSLCVAIAAGKFQRPTELRPGLPPAIDDWFAKCFAVKTPDRFQSAREMAVDFAHAMQGAIGATEAEFSVVGESRPSKASDWGEEAPGPAVATLVSARELSEAVTMPAARKGPPTFAGAALTAPPPKRRLSREAMVGIGAAVVLLFAGGSVLVLSSSHGSASSSAPRDPASAEPGPLPAAASGETADRAPSAAADSDQTAAGTSAPAVAASLTAPTATPDASATANASTSPSASVAPTAEAKSPRLSRHAGGSASAPAAGPSSAPSAAAAPTTATTSPTPPTSTPSGTSHATSAPAPPVTASPKDRGF